MFVCACPIASVFLLMFFCLCSFVLMLFCLCSFVLMLFCLCYFADVFSPHLCVGFLVLGLSLSFSSFCSSSSFSSSPPPLLLLCHPHGNPRHLTHHPLITHSSHSSITHLSLIHLTHHSLTLTHQSRTYPSYISLITHLHSLINHALITHSSITHLSLTHLTHHSLITHSSLKHHRHKTHLNATKRSLLAAQTPLYALSLLVCSGRL